MRKFLFMIFTLFVMSGNLEAGTLEEKIKECSLIKSDKRRLACYDKLAVSFRQQESTSNKTKWNIDKDISPIDDSPIVTLMLPSDQSSASRGVSFLCIRYKNNETNVFIAWNEYIGSDDGCAVITRFDKEKPEKRTWGISTSGTGSFYQGKEIDFIRKILKHKKLFARVTHYNQETTSATFDITGLSNVIKPICELEGWSLISYK